MYIILPVEENSFFLNNTQTVKYRNIESIVISEYINLDVSIHSYFFIFLPSIRDTSVRVLM